MGRLISLLIGAIIASVAVASPGYAQDQVTRVSFEVEAVTVSADLPCKTPVPGPKGTRGSQSYVCKIGDALFVLAHAVESDGPSMGPMVGDFDEAYKRVEESRDTESVEQNMMSGRRTMFARRGPDPTYGFMRAVELAPGAVIYAIGLSRPGLLQPLSQKEKALIDVFADTLEITP